MLRGSAGQLLIDAELPPELRTGRVLDKKGLSALLSELGRKYPERYRDVLSRLAVLSRTASYFTGGHSFGPEHLLASPAIRSMRQEIQGKVDALYADRSLKPADREKRILETVAGYQDPLEKLVWDESLREGNPLAGQVQSGSRGNKTNLRSLRGADLLYVDHHDNPIPVPVLRSYGEGLRPHEYYAGTFGARKGVVDTKLSVGDTGYIGKKMAQAAHRLLVTAHDADTPPSGLRGMPVDTDDSHNEGAVLAHDVGGYKRNSVLTPAILSHLRDQGHKQILVRSPTVGGSPSGGVYSLDAGVREKGRLAPPGDFIGLSAAQALGEGLTQGSLSSKHTGGVAGASSGAVGGYHLVDQLMEHPAVFKGGAAHSQADGNVQTVASAPQGGFWVTVDGHQHHVAHGNKVLASPGDQVEAGDVLSEGVPNPAEIVRHKGIGEGRRYFTQLLRQVYRDMGVPAHRRNIELLARGLIDHIRMTDEYGRHVPDDLVKYSALEHDWEPRPGHRVLDPRQARGLYLEEPVLHYSIGTKIRPSVVKTLQAFGVDRVTTHHLPPPFEPEMVRGLENLSADPDWLTRFLGSYVKKNFLRGVHRGDVSDERGTSYVPSLVRAVDFNLFPPVKGYEPELGDHRRPAGLKVDGTT
jgi:hypothetical protein